MSPIDYNEAIRLEQFGPTVGNSVVIHIRSCERVEDLENKKDKNFFKSKTEHAGYRYEYTLTNGRVFYGNNWKLNSEFVRNNVQDGDKIDINHVSKSKYIVTVLERGTGIGLEIPDLEKELYLEHKKNGTLVNGKVPEGSQVAVETPAPVSVAAPEATPAERVQQPAQQVPVENTNKAEEKDLDLPF